ncbi:uncharacterized protein A1O9_08563 [Exophiala aquamarina CBS 119918]|uniref:UDP-N-acetylglucosamine 1-carboxyvinyltransferase n=1 Tax=Exophiala aquamarina CBS 119918 TaxID=1182545 RepID=A0A072P7Y2_9EURO|nr:uncharacterized protein A1O9_08563 [Exophiala aquamarina CBS 119918]KEF55812.1 hypothetical protein A1O9_08563 [Exophiala aquamarina CBS 119918]
MSYTDPTFRNYAPVAAANYAALRPLYPEKVINTIIEVHKSTGGQMETLLDVGCGPGTATLSLAPFFQHAFGADPGESMIERARQHPPQTANGEETKFVVCAAEDLMSISDIQVGTVDLITAGTAAHWFQLPTFYACAAKILRPGGTIALWCTGSLYCHPHSTPNAARVQEVYSRLTQEILGPYELPRNKLYRNLYENLELPWTIQDMDPSTQGAMEAFDKSNFKRVEFNKAGQVEPNEGFVLGMTSSLDMLQQGLGTGSGVARWREAHKDQLEKGEVEDCAAYIIRMLKQAMAEGPGGKERDWIEGGTPIVSADHCSTFHDSGGFVEHGSNIPGRDQFYIRIEIQSRCISVNESTHETNMTLESTLRICRSNLLRGTINISGSKNASLPILAATLLNIGENILENVPQIRDTAQMCFILQYLGAHIYRPDDSLHIETSCVGPRTIPESLAGTLRGSILFLGPLLARYGHAQIAFPGGCAIGARPIDQHIKGLQALGAEVSWNGNMVEAKAPSGLRSGEVRFDVPTVTGTANILMAATRIEGTTVIYNAAREPEIVDLAVVLSRMGAIIEGAGTYCITISGRSSLYPILHRLMADRIECGTYMVAGALFGIPLTILGGVPTHQTMLREKLEEFGARIVIKGETMVVYRATNPGPVTIETAPYPGIPTDLQAPLMTLVVTAAGVSTITENMFENRFAHALELNRMGAQIRLDGNSAIITGVSMLSGTTVVASDLRGGAALVLAGLFANGCTRIKNAELVDRGYEKIEEKLKGSSAKIWRETRDDAGSSEHKC